MPDETPLPRQVRPEAATAYRAEDGAPRLVESVVAFLDLLGFRKASKGPDPLPSLRALRAALDGAAMHARDTLIERVSPVLIIPPRWVMRVFTDNIAIVYPILQHRGVVQSLGNLIGNLAWFQAYMSRRGFPVRGSIAIGQAYVDEDIVFGPAIVEAYEAECTIAHMPRIVLCDRAAQLLLDDLPRHGRDHFSPQWQELRRDTDGRPFIDYLNAPVRVAEDDIGADDQLLRDHRDVIAANIAQFGGDERILAKYRWMAAYHNKFCQRFNYSAVLTVTGVEPGGDTAISRSSLGLRDGI